MDEKRMVSSGWSKSDKLAALHFEGDNTTIAGATYQGGTGEAKDLADEIAGRWNEHTALQDENARLWDYHFATANQPIPEGEDILLWMSGYREMIRRSAEAIRQAPARRQNNDESMTTTIAYGPKNK
jgi:hypothetical protein